MAKVDYRKISPMEREKMLKALSKVILAGRTEIKTRRLLEQLLTPSEVVMLTRRIQIASMLVQGKSQWDIREQLGAGFSTIRAVESWLNETLKDYRGIRTFAKDKQRQRKQTDTSVSVADWRENPFKIGMKASEPYFVLLQLLMNGIEYFLVNKENEENRKRL
jgi:uncharacterized protein YerC